MRFLSSRTHGILDYLTGILLILSPRLFGFAGAGAASQVPVLLGVLTILYSLCTRYEFGLLRVLPLRFHLGLDFFAGVFLALSPWLFRFADAVWVPHFGVGLFEVVMSLLTRREPVLSSDASARGRRPRRTAAH